MPRKEKRYHFIYKTTNSINGKYYYGMHSTNNLNDGYIGSGKRLWCSIKKYGKENFKTDILEFLPNKVELKNKERELINEETLKDGLCMNLVYGGGGGFISPDGVKKGRKKTDEILFQRYGENFRSIIFNNFYNGLSDVDKEILNKKRKEGQIKSGFDYKTFLGKHHTDESKRKIGEFNSIHQKGEKNSQYGTCWITNGIESKKIKKTEINLFPNWKTGRIMNKNGAGIIGEA